jgi:peptide/nickel transport system permease protein
MQWDGAEGSNMASFLLRRALQAIVVLLGVTLVTFALEQIAPGSPAREVLGVRATPVAIAAFDRTYGLNRPFIVQYVLFLDHLVHGNLGFSWKQNRTVNSLVISELPRDILLVGVSVILALLIAIPVGIRQAVRRNGVFDYAATALSFLLYSMPPYIPGLLAISLLAVRLQVLPSEAPQGASVGGLVAHPSGLILPVLTLTLISFASFSRYVRSSGISILEQDFILTARTKGLRARTIVWRHVLRNSLGPVITLVGLALPQVLTAGLVVEYLFNFQGVGLEYYNAAVNGDFPVMVAITLLVAAVTVIGNLAADVAYAVLDPRVRLA